ncbi:hypothetical protein GCM10007276_15900 [Agaricicola taiwanensis]|uniref:Uncharacterized protein n=1 Tax=Agaricicola taiwanensis TaxID=591372 RepID=A0A8J2YH10_9RHOB|nr:hypothetical protein [Agaricicola taiwanensis]GGE39388.1 hypothetical protein GCM10007276_15900 [Agaricicola taiwanensis]
MNKNNTGRIVLYGLLAVAALIIVVLSWENYVADPGPNPTDIQDVPTRQPGG